MNPARMDGLNLQRLTKNSPELGDNLVTVLKHKKTGSHAPLVAFQVRGTGGYGGVVGCNPADSSKANVRREAPTHLPSAGQDPTSQHAWALFGLIRAQQCVNIFFRGYYIGLFYAKEASVKEHSHEVALDHLRRLRKNLTEINELTSDLVPKEVTSAMSGELMGMMAVTNSVTLVPVDPNFSSRWQSNSDIFPWSVVHLGAGDISRPVVFTEKETVDCEILLSNETKFTHWSAVIEKNPTDLSFLSASGREKFGIDVGDEFDPQDLCIDEHEDNGTVNMSQVRGAAFHAAAITTANAVGNCVIEPETIIPPRFILHEITASQNLSYQDGIKSYNIKSLLNRPLHPATLSFEPAILMAQDANNCSPELQALNQECMWQERNGPIYVTDEKTKEEAHTIIFRCVLCCILNPPALLQLSRHMQTINGALGIERKALFVPAPADNEFKQLKDFIISLKWESRFIHKIFREGTLFPNALGFIDFVSMLKDKGTQIFKSALVMSNVAPSRQQISSHLSKHLTFANGAKLSPFQVQVIMRTIESCIHDPFGVVDVVQSGPGGKQGASCLILDFDKSVKSGDVTSSVMSKLDKCKAIPNWIVQCYNTWVSEVYNIAEAKSMKDCNDELFVLRLRWSKELLCLVHVDGIGKKIDASDAEHMLCMIYCMHQYTLPNRNVAIKKSSRIDSEKYLPVRNSGGLLAKEMPFMHPIHVSFAETMAAYNRLLMDESYPHRKLAGIFGIDFL